MAEPAEILIPMFEGNSFRQWRAMYDQYFRLEEENRSEDVVLGIKTQEKNHGGREDLKLLDGPLKQSRKKETKEESEREKETKEVRKLLVNTSHCKNP